MSEKWDAYDKEFNIIDNMILERGQKIPKDVYHLVGEIIVKHIDGTYLLMQRDLRKHLGGMWELTAGGSALQGENPLECAISESAEETVIREVKEEIGQEVDSLKFISSYPYEKREMLMLGYKAIVKKKEFELSCEVDSVEWVKFTDALAKLREGSIGWQLVKTVIEG